MTARGILAPTFRSLKIEHWCKQAKQPIGHLGPFVVYLAFKFKLN